MRKIIVAISMLVALLAKSATAQEPIYLPTILKAPFPHIAADVGALYGWVWIEHEDWTVPWYGADTTVFAIPSQGSYVRQTVRDSYRFEGLPTSGNPYTISGYSAVEMPDGSTRLYGGDRKNINVIADEEILVGLILCYPPCSR